jgi:hypothetical protein
MVGGEGEGSHKYISSEKSLTGFFEEAHGFILCLLYIPKLL